MTDDDDTVIIREAEDNVTKREGAREAEKEREEAFNAAYEWQGKTFEGISASRMDVWRSLCHKGGFPAMEPCFDDTDLFYPRAKAIIFISQITTEELKRLRAKGMDAVLEAYENWVDKFVPHHAEKAALTLGLRIFNQAYANRAEIIPDGPDGRGKP
jgi:hypothetical protein